MFVGPDGGGTARGDGVDPLDVHGVNFLEAAVLGLDDEEEDDEHEGGTAAGKDQAVQVVNLVGDESGAIEICQLLSAIITWSRRGRFARQDEIVMPSIDLQEGDEAAQEKLAALFNLDSRRRRNTHKFHNQFEAVARPMHVLRKREG